MLTTRTLFAFMLISLFLSYLIIDFIYSATWTLKSNEWTIEWQSKTNSGFFKYLFLILGYAAYAILGVILLLWIWPGSKARVIRSITYVISIVYFTSWIALIYHNPRPYMENSNIKALECYSLWGRPSGHAMNTIVFYGVILLLHVNPLLFGKSEEENEQAAGLGRSGPRLNSRAETIATMSDNAEERRSIRSSEWQPPKPETTTCKKISGVLLWLVLFVLIGFMTLGRIYLGSHSFDEILLGWAYGITIVGLIALLIDPALSRWYQNVITPKGFFNKQLVVITVLFICMEAIPTITYAIVSTNVGYETQWLINMQRECGYEPNDLILSEANYANAGVISALFGMLFGLLTTRGEYGFRLKITKENIWKYVTIQVFGLACLAAPFFSMNWTVTGHNPYYVFFIANGVKFFATTFCWIAIPPVIFRKWFEALRDPASLEMMTSNGPVIIVMDSDRRMEEMEEKTWRKKFSNIVDIDLEKKMSKLPGYPMKMLASKT